MNCFPISYPQVEPANKTLSQLLEMEDEAGRNMDVILRMVSL